jgi:hypothetical protein
MTVTYLSTADTAKLIRAELKKAFPKTTFSVRSKVYSGGSSIRVTWSDGPTDAAVQSLLNRFRGSDFDGMQDMKISREAVWLDGRRVRMGADHIFTKRSYSHAFAAHVARSVALKYGVPEAAVVERHEGYGWDCDTPSGLVRSWGEDTVADLCRAFARDESAIRVMLNQAAPVTAQLVAGDAPAESADQRIRYNRDWTWVHGIPADNPAGDALRGLGFFFSHKRQAWFAKTTVAESDILAVLGDATSAAPAAVEQPTPAPDAAPAMNPVAAKLRKAAETAQQQADKKRNSGIYNQNPTPRRMRMLEGIEADAERLELLAGTLLRLADAHEAETVPDALRNVTTKAMLEWMLDYDRLPSQDGNPDLYLAFIRAGVVDRRYTDARAALLRLARPVERETPRERQIRDALRNLVGVPLPGYFPTPWPVIERLLHEAGISAEHTVLEPSAGAGHIADAIRESVPGVVLTVIEQQQRLVHILELKGYAPIWGDCTEHTDTYDRIVMNPPFEAGQDIAHVQHAYKLLNPGGRLVAVMSEGPFFRNDTASRSFREWLELEGGWSEQLPDGSFARSDRPTGVATRVVVIDKD